MNFDEKLLDTLKRFDGYFSQNQIFAQLNVRSAFEKKAVKTSLEHLSQQGKICFDKRKNKYCVSEGRFFVGEVDGNRRGFAFVVRQDGEEDLFIPHGSLHGALHRDTVLVRKKEGTRDEGEVVRVLRRGMTSLVGVYEKKNGTRFVVPDEKKFACDVRIAPKRDMNAKNGQKVVVKISSYPKDGSPEGEITQILGYADERDVDMLSVAYSFGIRDSFDDAVLRAAEKLPQTVSAKEIQGRRDLRREKIVTIDGEEAKDLDDAVSCRKNADGTYTLGVHIADVSHYVKPSDDVDKEAFDRGTSVYFPDRVFPMLPVALSNGICSLYPQVDRLTLSVVMKIDDKGKVVSFDVVKSVIHSAHRMTYDEVQKILDGDKKLTARYADVADMLQDMRRLAEILLKKRERRGTVDFAAKEVKFIFRQGEVTDIVPYERTFSHRLIEEFMIAANETVASYAESCGVPFVYRVHEKPQTEKAEALFALLQSVGIPVKKRRETDLSVLSAALKQAENTPYFALVNEVMLRTMQKAKYSPVNIGHFGLASDCYCHFTSPIRRYPDLVVHRVLKTLIEGKMTEKAFVAYEDMCAETGRQASLKEKVADEAERKAETVKKCRFAQKLVGKTFGGLISGVTENGIFVQLENTVEGFVSVQDLPSGLSYDAGKFALSGGGKRFCLGDAVKVVLVAVHLAECKIDMLLAEERRAAGKAAAKGAFSVDKKKRSKI